MREHAYVLFFISSGGAGVDGWCVDNRMLANATKTKAMLVTTRQKRASLPEEQKTLKVKLNNTYLENVVSDRLLGTTINQDLSWEMHINIIIYYQ